jgi:phytoene dehydrogenase-like protein
MEVAGEERERMDIVIQTYDPTLAPAGKSIIVTTIMSNFPYWEKLYEDKDKYKEEKQRIADMVVAAMEARFPQIAGNVEVVDVATPITYKKFTNNWQGSFEGWLLTTDNMSSMAGKGMSKTLPGLDGFYMIGQWVMPGGGLPGAAQSGRDIIQIICHKEKKPFTTSEP